MNATKDCLTGAKGALQSKTIWGTVFQVLPLVDVIATAAGYPGMVNKGVAIASGIAGAVIAIYGRLTATDKIEGLITPPPPADSYTGPRSFCG